MDNQIAKIISEIKERVEKATQGPYRIERVDFDDDVTYEVSTQGKNFHVVFRESNCQCEGVTTKNQAELYANAPTDLKKLIEVVEVLSDVVKECRYQAIIRADEVQKSWCDEALRRAEEILR